MPAGEEGERRGQHYFSRAPVSAHHRRELLYELGSRRLMLVTDSGVFSKGEIDPGSRLLVATVKPPAGGRLLDLGCGYGPIGLALAIMCPGCQVHLTDVNERAVALARENAARNHLTNVCVHAGEGLAPVAEITFDLIVTNPPIRAGRAVLLELFAAALARLAPAGRLAFVARTRQGAQTLAREVSALGRPCVEVAKEAGYRVYESR